MKHIFYGTYKLYYQFCLIHIIDIYIFQFNFPFPQNLSTEYFCTLLPEIKTD